MCLTILIVQLILCSLASLLVVFDFASGSWFRKLTATRLRLWQVVLLTAVRVALKILPNTYKMARAGQRIDTNFSPYYYSLAKSG